MDASLRWCVADPDRIRTCTLRNLGLVKLDAYHQHPIGRGKTSGQSTAKTRCDTHYATGPRSIRVPTHVLAYSIRTHLSRTSTLAGRPIRVLACNPIMLACSYLHIPSPYVGGQHKALAEPASIS